MVWATVSSWSCSCRLYRASPSSAAKSMKWSWKNFTFYACCFRDLCRLSLPLTSFLAILPNCTLWCIPLRASQLNCTLWCIPLRASQLNCSLWCIPLRASQLNCSLWCIPLKSFTVKRLPSCSGRLSSILVPFCPGCQEAQRCSPGHPHGHSACSPPDPTLRGQHCRPLSCLCSLTHVCPWQTSSDFRRGRWTQASFV